MILGPNIYKNIMTLFTSFGIREGHDREAIRKIIMLNIFLALGGFLLFFMGVIALIQDAPVLGLSDFIISSLFFAALFYLHRTGNESLTSLLSVVTIFIFFCFLFSIGGVSKTAFMWLFSFPLFSLYLLGLRKGLLLAGLLFCYCCGFLAFDVLSDTLNVYGKDFALRFIPSYLVICMFTSLVEKSRSSTLDAMLEKQRLLAGTINELQQKETELKEARNQLEERVQLRTAELVKANNQLRIEIEERKKAEQERIRLESKLLRAEKMELLGRLASGVAHDLNNVLSGIVTYPDLLLLDLTPESDMFEPLQNIRTAGRHAATIVEDLLTLARRGIPVSKQVQLNDVIKAHLQSPEFITLRKNNPAVAIEKNLSSQLKSISGSPVHLQKTVMNLLLNSFEAIQHKGRISIVTKNLQINGSSQYKNIPTGFYTTLIISDDGIGIPKEKIDSIFEPFYSSKELGHSGTGLGMTIVWSTVQDHEGYLEVESSPGEGTTITLFFPSRNEQAHGELPLDITPHRVERGNREKILLVDDVSEQRKLCEQILTTLNYNVEKVANGKKALAFLKNTSVDLILLDMIMEPEMDGLDTYRKILQIQPNQKVIIISGYSETMRIKTALELGVRSYIRKPFSLESLATTIKEVLAAK